MKIVIQCVGRKFENAGRLTTFSGEEVFFVAPPERYKLQNKCYRLDNNMEGLDWIKVLWDQVIL